jgi:hypothetical protein
VPPFSRISARTGLAHVVPADLHDADELDGLRERAEPERRLLLQLLTAVRDGALGLCDQAIPLGDVLGLLVGDDATGVAADAARFFRR